MENNKMRTKYLVESLWLAKETNADVVIRITSDNQLISPDIQR